jgi:hypothetical protein
MNRQRRGNLDACSHEEHQHAVAVGRIERAPPVATTGRPIRTPNLSVKVAMQALPPALIACWPPVPVLFPPETTLMRDTGPRRTPADRNPIVE